MMEKALLNIDKRATFYQIFGSTVTSKLRIPAWFLKHISEESPGKATLKCLSGGTWNVKLRRDEDSLLIRKGWKKFQKHNQLEEGELLVFRYDGALKFTVRIFGTNGLEREVKTPTMDKNKKASIYDGGRKRKRPEKYPYSSKFPKQTHVNGENGTEYETPQKRDAVEKAEDLLTPNIPQFVKCLKGYNVNKSCFLYVPKSFYEQLSKSDNKTTVILRNSEGKEWRVNCVSQKGYCAFCGGWKQFASDNKLKQGHVCVFQLVNANELKVSFFHDPSESLLKEEEKERATIMCKKKKPRSKGRCVEEKEEEDDDDEEEYEEEEEEEDETEEEEEDEIERVPRSKRIHVEEKDDDEEEGYEEETEEEEEEEEEEETARAGVFKKKSPRVKAGCKRVTVCKLKDFHDQYGADIFKSGRATQPKNPYFVAKIRTKRRDQLYVPVDVVRDYKLEIPPKMIIRDAAGREIVAKLKNWKDGRKWLHGGWRNLCRWNLVEKDDRCICEFVKGKGKKGLCLQVQFLHEGASSQP